MFFGQRSRLSMQKFLCDMSENGYHLVKITRTRCIFSEEISRRFVYSLCAEGDETLYAQGDEWRELLTFKGIRFYCKEIPPDAVKTERSFDKKRVKAEKLWLDARLAEGMVLLDTLDGEYIFRRDTSFSEYEYYIARPHKKKPKKGETPSDALAEARLMRFMTVSDDGSTYYFLNNSGVKRSAKPEKGRRLSDLLIALFISTGSALAFCASALLTVFGVIGANINGSPVIPWALGGSAAAMLFAILFVIFFLRFRSVSELRRLSDEEALARQAMASAASHEPEAPDVNETTNNNNNIVMNTVVLNNYGNKKTSADMSAGEFDPNLQAVMGQVFGAGKAIAEGQPPSPQLLTDAVSPTPVYEVEPQNENDIWQGTEIFGASSNAQIPEPEPIPPPLPPKSDIDDDAWVSAEPEPEPDEEYDEPEYNEGFPILSFIGYALLCFASVAVFLLGLRYGIGWFVSADKSNALTLAMSALGVAFSPFICYNSFTACRDILTESGDELE